MGKKAKKKKRKNRKQPAGRQMRLSLCMIVRDEAAFLDQCLQSVQGLADEIVVVDTGSTDETLRVARRHKARVFTQPWKDDFSAARNRSLEKARGEWILVLDCDEVVARKDHDPIRQALAQEGIDAFRLTTRNYIDQANRVGWMACSGAYAEEKQYSGWFPTTKVRLWRSRREIRFEGTVHELVEPSVLKAGGKIGDCLVPVHHYGYTEKTRSQDRYVEAGEQKVRDDPADLQACYELAIVYRDAGRLQEALERIEVVIAGLEEADQKSGIYLQEELVLLVHADVLARLGRNSGALEGYDQILERFPRSYQAFNNKGAILERLGRLEEACQCYEQGADIAPDNRILADNLARLNLSGDRVGSLSVCIIARDEEAVIGRCLESIRPVADEIVMVDTGSTDRTVEIAEQFGAKIGRFAWCDDFSAARNASLELATGEWILWMDADDYFLPADQHKVQKAKGLQLDQAFYFTLVNEGADRSCFRQVKMFPNLPEIRFERTVHESVVPSLQSLGLPMRSIDVEVRHTGYAEEGVTKRKSRYYLGLMQEWFEGHPDDYQTCFRIGYTHYIDGEREKARESFARILEVDPKGGEQLSAIRLAATFSGRSLLEELRYAEAIPFLERARSLQAGDALVLLSLGDAHTKLGSYEKAVEYLQEALQGRVDPFFPLDARVIEYSARFFLGQAFQALGRNCEAEAAFEAARELMPERQEAALALEQIDQQVPAKTGLYAQSQEVAASSREKKGGEQRLSLCMIVRDEEERLANCLESAQGLVDEIVVVDTGSKDGTVEIAEKFGARIGYFAWCDDFSAARNESLRMASGDWIMWLDADDVLPAEEHARIRELIGQGRDKSFFFALDDQGYEHVSCLQMRLFPNLSGVEFEMPIHEQVTPSLARLGVEMVSTDIRVVHTGYSTPEVVRAKKSRYLGIMERWLKEHPETYIVRSHVALTYHTTGRLDEAVDAYRKIIYESSCLQDRNYVVYTTALLFLGRTYLKKKELEPALDYARQAEEIDPDYILTKLSLAEIYMRLEDFASSLKYARAVLEGERQMTFFPVDYPEVIYSAHLLCGQAHQGLEEWDEAEIAFRRAAEMPVARRTQALGSLSELFRAQGNNEKALEVLEEARQADPENVQHLFNYGSIYLEQKELDRASEFFNQVVERAPDFAPALLNLGFIAKTQGKIEAAERIYQQAIQSDPEGVEARANLGHLYLDQERFEEAGQLLHQVRARQTGLLDIDLGLLVTLCRRGDWKEVVELMREILELFPELERLEGDLEDSFQAARTLVRLGAILIRRKLSKCAEFAFIGAVFLDENFHEARRGLAEMYFVQAVYWKAIAQYEAILQAVPQDGGVFQRLGDCYQRLGVEEAARMCYEKSRLLGGV